jgi:hypothetical protein
MIGAISIVIKLIKVWLMSFAVGPNDLKQKPTTTPNKMPRITWKFRLVKSFFMQNKYTLIR